MIKHLFSTSLLIFISFSLLAQTEDILVQSIDKTIEIKYAPDKKTDPTQKLLLLVAKAKGVGKESATLNFKAKEYQKIIKNPDNLQLQLSLSNVIFNDDISYQKFNINSYIIPGLISYSYVWADENDKIIKSETVKNKPFKNGAFLLKDNVENTFTSSVFKLYLSDISFGFTEADATKLEEFMNLIDGYYNADARLNLMEQELTKITTDSIEMLEAYKQTTIDNVKTLNLMRSERYSSKLDLDANDPLQYKSHFGRVETQNRNVKIELDKTIDNMQVAYYLKGKDWLNWKDTVNAITLFNKSISVMAAYAPPHYELANISYNKKNYGAAIDSCAIILKELKPDTDTRYNTVKLAESVIYVYINQINGLIASRQFTLAMEKLNLCENYSNNIPGVKKFEEFNQIHGKLFNAYYTDFAETTAILISGNQLHQAHFNVDSLAQFRTLHSAYIQNADKEYELIKSLYTAYINQGTYYLENNRTDSSLFAFNQAFNLCNKHANVVKCTDELVQLLQKAQLAQYNFMITQADTLIVEQLADSAITLLNNAEMLRQQNNLEKNNQVDGLYIKAQQIKYADLIKVGFLAYEENKPREALAYFEEAVSIKTTYKIISDTSLQQKIIWAAQPYVLQICIQGEGFVEIFQVAQAQQKLDEAVRVSEKYGLTMDEECVLAITSLKEKLSSGNCEKVKYDYNVQSIAAKKFIQQKEFIYASQALNKAAQIKQSNGDCILSDTSNIRVANEINPMVQYQNKVLEINKLLDSKDFSNVIFDYENLTVFYGDSCTKSFGVEHKPLFNYVITHSNLSLINYAVKYYAEKGTSDTAMVLLDHLCTKKFIADLSEESQIALGTQLANIDMQVVPAIDPKVKVTDYTKYNKWYNYLKKAYLQQWKLK